MPLSLSGMEVYPCKSLKILSGVLIYMHDKLASAVSHVRELENRLKENALGLRSSNFTSSEFLEGSMIMEMPEPTAVSGRICAVDSGLLAYSAHGVDIALLRAVAVIFSYSASGLLSCAYHPCKVPEPEIEVKIALDEHDTLAWRSLIRLKSEITAALDAIEKHSPEAVLLDGSVLPLAKDRPGSDSTLFKEYEELIRLYKKLYSACMEKGMVLAGVIKDSRGMRFMDAVAEQVKEGCNDSTFLNYLLKERERTSVMPYAAEAQRQPVLKDIGEFSESMFVCYLKIAKNDQPLRIEFLDFGRDFVKPVSLIHSLSAISGNYAYPAALTEADLCAAMDERDMERVTRAFSGFGVSRALRRNSRPFR